MGKNVKFLMGFDVPFWAGQKGLGFSTDGPINLVWESTENQIGPENEIALAAFSGGEDAEACLRWKASEQQTHYLQELGRAYKNADQAFVKGEFENWPGARDPGEKPMHLGEIFWSPAPQTPRTSSNTVISGRSPSRMGKPVIPMPRFM